MEENNYRNLQGFKTLERIHYEQNHLVDDKAEKRLKILLFWKKYGMQATIDAYGTSERTLYAWKKKFSKGEGKLSSLSNKKTVPKKKRKREWDYRIQEKIQGLREEYPKSLKREDISNSQTVLYEEMMGISLSE